MMYLQICVSTAFVLLLAHYIRAYRRLSAFPGPFAARFTNLWKVYRFWKGDYIDILLKWHERYGPVIRVGPNDLSVADATSVPKMYGVNPVFPKGSVYKLTTYWYRGKNVSGIEGVDENQHTMLRKAIGNPFTVASVMNYESRLDECISELMSQLDKLEQFDMVRWFTCYTVDVIRLIAFSTPPHHMKSGTDVYSSFNIMKLFAKLVSRLIAMPMLTYHMARVVSYLVGPSWQLVAMGLDTLEARMKQIDSSKESRKHDLLEAYMEAHEQRPDLMPPERVLGMTMSTILGGSDTVAHTLTTTLHSLLKHPQTLNRLVDELDHAYRQGQLSYPPTLKELSRLPYLEVIIKEGLRTANFLQLKHDRVVPEGGTEISGQHIPEGTEVGCVTSIVHHDRSVYGPDAAIFRPERWIEASDEQRKTMERCGLWFGNGKHLCIGQHIAMAEMRKVLATILMRFEISDVDPDARLSWNTTTIMNFPEQPYFVSLERRDLSPSTVSI